MGGNGINNIKGPGIPAIVSPTGMATKGQTGGTALGIDRPLLQPGAAQPSSIIDRRLMPFQDIRSFVVRAGFKDLDAAIDNIHTMAAGIWGDMRPKFFESVLPRLAALPFGQNIDAAFAQLAGISRTFDQAGQDVITTSSNISHSVFMRDKLDLYQTICRHPEGLANLFDPTIDRIAETFGTIAKFSCRLLLFTMFEYPDHFGELTAIVGYPSAKVPEKRMREMRREIGSGLRQAEARLKELPEFRALPDNEKADLVFREEVEFLRKYSHFGLVRIACIYLREFIGRGDPAGAGGMQKEMFEAAKRNMRQIYDEMSNLSNALLGSAFLIAQRNAWAHYGKPLKDLRLPDEPKAARAELRSIDALMNRIEDARVRRAFESSHKTQRKRLARMRRLLEKHRTDFEKVDLAAEGPERYDSGPRMSALIWKGLSARERFVINSAFSRADDGMDAATSVANYLFGMYRLLRESRFALLLGGANARREFPSFDYDCFFVYEEDGTTTAGKTNREYFRYLIDRLSTAITEIDHRCDSFFAPFKNDFGTPREMAGFFNRKDIASYANARAFTALGYGAGDRDFAQQVIDDIYRFVYQPETAQALTLMRVHQHHLMRTSTGMNEEYPGSEINIKYHPGGLRDIAILFWIYKLLNGQRENDVFRILHELGKKYPRLIPPLTESYQFLMDIRIRLDLDIGRNNKELPSREEGLERLAKALGYGEDNPYRRFSNEVLGHRGRISAISGELVGKLADVEAISKALRGKVDLDGLRNEMEKTY